VSWKRIKTGILSNYVEYTGKGPKNEEIHDTRFYYYCNTLGGSPKDKYLINPSKIYYLFPGTILTGLSLLVAIVSFFTVDGWSIMGYFFLFVFIAASSLIGTFIGKKFAHDI